MNFPENLKYTEDHEWIKVEGETLGAGEVFGNIEAVKTVSELLLPAAGEILELNPALADDPSLVNKDPYGQGWIIKVKLTDAAAVASLMDAAAYKAKIGA